MTRIVVKTLYIVIGMLLILSCASCSDDPYYYPEIVTPEDESMDELLKFSYKHINDPPLKYQNNTNAYIGFYEDNLYIKSKSVFYRINPLSGYKTTVCPDPICSHETETCPVYSIASAFCVHEGVFYFDKLTMAETETKESISAFDLSSSKISTVYDRTQCSKQYIRMMIYEDYLYFYKSYYVGEDDNKKIISDIAGVNLKTGDVIDVIKYDTSVFDHLIGGDGGYLFLCNPTGGIFRIKAGESLPSKEYLYSFDKSDLLNYAPDRMALKNGYIYYYTSSNDSTDFWRIPTSGGEPQNFVSDNGIKADYCFYTQNYIYYSAITQKKIGVIDGEDLMCDIYDIRRVSYENGSCEEVFRDFPEEYDTYSLSGGYIVSGNYIYTHTWDWGELKDKYTDSDCRYDSGYSGVIARIDIETGEIRYIGSNLK